MIGNDVVDLALARAESNWKRRGFLQKLFTESEQKCIAGASNPESMVWNLWSRKEAAYKIYNRQTGIRAFIPLQLECVFENACEGQVNIGSHSYLTRTCISAQKIHTIAVVEKADFANVIYLYDVADISKTDGFPYQIGSKNAVSKSHHGRFEEIVSLRS